MMRMFRNEKGIALVMVLVLSLLSLAFVSALLFMVTQGTKVSGSHRLYRTAEEASLGAAESVNDYIKTRGETRGDNFAAILGSNCDCRDTDDTEDNIDNALATPGRSCRCDKICNATAFYDHADGVTGNGLCDEDTGAGADGVQVLLDPTTKYDEKIRVDTGTSSYDLFIKIVDTVKGNSEQGNIVASNVLGGTGVVNSTSGIIPAPHIPYLYRIEVEGQNSSNPREHSRVSVLYAF
jgi:hypothetical protein